MRNDVRLRRLTHLVLALTAIGALAAACPDGGDGVAPDVDPDVDLPDQGLVIGE